MGPAVSQNLGSQDCDPYSFIYKDLTITLQERGGGEEI